MGKFDVLNNPDEINKIDRSGMLAVIASMPEMLEEGLANRCVGALPSIKKFKQIVVCGMGGSAIAGDIVAGMVDVPLLVNRSYRLPAFVGKDTLVFALSYSGNTEETLSAVKEAEKKGAKIVCITSGGELKALAEKKQYPYFLVPDSFQPRAALPHLLGALLQGIRIDEGRAEAVSLLKKLRAEYKVDVPLRANPAKQLAKKVEGKIPVIFAVSGTTAAAGLRFKSQLSENGKMTSLLGLFPELDHNEIVSLSVLKRTEHDHMLIVLRDEDDTERIRKRIEITKSLLTKQLGGAYEIFAQGRSSLAKLLSLVYLTDFVSAYAAVNRQVDPTPVDIISRLKREMAR
ncbi:MAG: bifunctional phosphoglucose/phosphomannose isomerase [Candidatus Margulisiibacteriota bacterium]